MLSAPASIPASTEVSLVPAQPFAPGTVNNSSATCTSPIRPASIIAENAIFTYLQFAHNRETLGVDEALTFAIGTRLRPKLMTALGAIIALLPIALGIGAGAQLHQPLAIAVIGGFLVALPLLLLVFPSMLRALFRE